MTSRREHLLILAELHNGLSSTHALIAQELATLATLDSVAPNPPQPEPDTPDPDTPVTHMGRWIEPFKLTVCALAQRPDHAQPKNGLTYRLKDLFTTRDGSWDPSDKPGSIDLWARVRYLKPMNAPDYFDDAGAATHLFAAVIGLDGQLVRGQQIVFWSDGLGQLANPTYQKYITQYTKEKSGWCNLFMAPSSSYVPERGEAGPWCWCPAGASDVVVGAGLPARQHISTFAVWQAVRV